MKTLSQKSNFQIRVISALLFFAIIIAGYYFLGNSGLLFIGLVVSAFLILEGGNLLGMNQVPSKFLKFYFYFSTSIILFIYLFISIQFTLLFFTIFALFFFVISLSYGVHKTEDITYVLQYQLKTLLGWIYLGLLPAMCLEILLKPKGDFWFLFLLAIVFAGDIMAYIIGKLFGSHLVLPLISPKKTWEGVLGGWLGSTTISLIVWKFNFQNVSIFQIIFCATAVSFFAQGGDFFESLLKRITNVKDSGSIMPGHGGLLDRTDGLLFASPIMAYFISQYERFF